MQKNLLTTGNPKIEKGAAFGFLPFILHLAPANLSGFETCPKRTAGCTAACLNTAGRGGMFKRGETTNAIQQARIRKTHAFFEQRDEFMSALAADIARGIRKAQRKGLTPVFRLNGTSDIAWEKIRVEYNGRIHRNIFAAFPEVQFYDYTKIPKRHLVATIPNYHLTFSAADNNEHEVAQAIAAGLNVAVVFGLKKTEAMPARYIGMPVFNGDDSDLRFLDPKGHVIGLYAKGKAKTDTTGFVKYPTITLQLAA